MWILVGIVVTLGVYSFYIEPRRFRLIRVRMKTRREFEGNLKILHISDLHLRKGDEAKLAFLRGLQKTPVDMVFVTGDIIEDDSGINDCVKLLEGFKASIGVFVVFGAHDRWDTRLWNVIRDLSTARYHRGQPNDIERFKRGLENIGVAYLENTSCMVALPNNPGEGRAENTDLWIVGVGDVFAGLGDFDKALAGVPENAFRILLTHSIEDPQQVAARRFDAVFAGHSHGGQVRIPFYGAVITRSSLKREYASGMFKVAGTPFHINNGIGTGKWTGFRFLCRPEATLVEITGSRSSDSN